MTTGFSFTPGFGDDTELNDKFAGAGMVDTVAGLVKAVNEQDSSSIAAFSVGLAFDTVGAMLNPLGSLLAAGVGWLIDHLFFLREPLDLLIGDNIAIRQETEKLKEDAEHYEGLASGHLDALKKLDGWIGETADNFRASMAHVAKELEVIGSAVNSSAKLMGTMGAVVTAVRSLVRDIIAMVVGGLIGGALIAASLAPFTFGASIVAFVGVAVGTALEALARILTHITKLKSVLSSSAKATDDLGAALAKMGDDAARFGKGGSSSGVSTPPPVKGPGDSPPSVNGGSGAGGAKPPAGDAPPVQKPPEVNGGPGGSSGGTKPPGDNTGTAGVKPDDAAPKPAGGDAGTPKPPAGDSAAPKPPGADGPGAPGAPKPDSAAPKPSGSDAPATRGPGGAGGSASPGAWTQATKHVDDLSKVSKDRLESTLTTKFGKTPDEAAGITQWIKNFEGVAAPGGQITVAGKTVATGSFLHLVHELWKELGADKHAQDENKDFMADLKEHNNSQP
ncbi:hypothetical protein [Lentzea sp. NPDC059081]|uniref:hypothetical protein n=1 Tax=Lentzea sp. NPDC059081 TaxID=3346719 RepID=UPI0036CACD9A